MRATCSSSGGRPSLLIGASTLSPARASWAGAEDHIMQKTADLNAALGLDFNAVEWCITKDGTPVIIDSYNDVPDVRREKLPPPPTTGSWTGSARA